MNRRPRPAGTPSPTASTPHATEARIRLAQRVELDTSAVKDIPPDVAARMLEWLDASDRRYADALQLQSVFQTLAGTDELTGLANRRALEERLELEVDRAQRYGRYLTVVMCDIDGFKRINDAYGHCAGDAVLVSLSRRLRKAVRQSDLVGRWGGDEFLVICPELCHMGAQRLARKLGAAARQPLALRGHELRPSMSVGWTACVGHEATIEALVEGADRALYQAKRRADAEFWSEWAFG